MVIKNPKAYTIPMVTLRYKISCQNIKSFRNKCFKTRILINNVKSETASEVVIKIKIMKKEGDFRDYTEKESPKGYKPK